MLIFQTAYRTVFLLFLLVCTPSCIYSDTYPQPFGYINRSSEVLEKGIPNQNTIRKNSLINKSSVEVGRKYKKLTYYLYVSDFINSFITIPTSNVSGSSSTIASSYLAGRAPIYNKHNKKVGICSASFLNMQNADGIYTDISNYLSVDNGLIISWFTPAKPINLELDSIINSMVTKCIVKASTQIAIKNPFYGKNFNLIVSSDDQKIYFKLYRYKRI